MAFGLLQTDKRQNINWNLVENALNSTHINDRDVERNEIFQSNL